jgi:probable HAF family extracellular repeat protein
MTAIVGMERQEVLAISADGNVVVGEDLIEGKRQAFRWTASNNAVQTLGTLPGYTESMARHVSADGRVVAGMCMNSEALMAFRWTADGGMQSMADWLTQAGVKLPEGMLLIDVTRISDNGNTVLGKGWYPTKEDYHVDTFTWIARITPDSKSK